MLSNLFDNILFSMIAKMSRSRFEINWPPECEPIIQDYRSADPNPPKKIYGSTTLPLRRKRLSRLLLHYKRSQNETKENEISLLCTHIVP
jgi:hypothetical protein